MTDYNKEGSVELNRDEAEVFKKFLKDNNIPYYPSECFNLIHFSFIGLSAEQIESVDNFLLTL